MIADIVRMNLKAHHLDIPGTAYFDPELDHLSEFYSAFPEKRAYFVAEDTNGILLGGAGLAEYSLFQSSAELQKLYLIDAAKGKGIGRALLITVQSYAAQLGYQELYLETHSNLAAALRLYERMKFQQIPKPDGIIHSTMNLFYKKRLTALPNHRLSGTSK